MVAPPGPIAKVAYVGEGYAVDHIAEFDLIAGQVVVQGELVGIAERAALTGELTALRTFGLFDFPKVALPGTGVEIAAGRPVFWDEIAQVVTVNSASGVNRLLGKTIAPTLENASVVRVRLAQ